MVDIIPSVFNRIDSWAMLLPGYVALILSMTLFFPSIFFVKHTNTANPTQNNLPNTITRGQVNPTSIEAQGISFDIFLL